MNKYSLGRVLVLFLASAASAAEPAFPSAVSGGIPAGTPPLFQTIGGAGFAGWTGWVSQAGEEATLTVPGEVVYRYPQGPKGWHDIGFVKAHDGTGDWSGYYGLQMDIAIPPGRTLELEATLLTPPPEEGKQEFIAQSKGIFRVAADGPWNRVTLPLESFDYNRSQTAFIKYIQELHLKGTFTEGKPEVGQIRVKNIRIVRAASLAMASSVRGKAVPAGSTATYTVVIGNCLEMPQEVRLTIVKEGWEAMTTTVKPERLTLGPGESASCEVSVSLPQTGIPPGGHERQALLAVTGDAGSVQARVEFITACDVARPCILHTTTGWDEVRSKVKRYEWARRSQDEDYVKVARKWIVPQAANPEQRAHGPERHPYVFMNPEFETLPKVAIAWQLTRNKDYAEKVAQFLRRLADEKTGYASTFAATSAGEPQEGGNFQGVAIAYDAILDSGVLSEADRLAIENMLRLYMRTIEVPLSVGNVGNWSTAAATAGLFCSLAMGDLAAAERYLYGHSGFVDYVTKGIMGDGWWWECSSSYNFWVASELTQMALACRPWGIDLLNREFPLNASPLTTIAPWALNPHFGMSFEKWGGTLRNTRSVKQLWDAVPPAADYRGVTFGMNDGHEEVVGGSRLELGYYAFRDPVYAAIIKQSNKRDLIYGVPELPAETPKPWLASGCAENIGYALLRSQTEKRPVREQIQAVFKIGTQGGYHGHFDRVSLNTIMRYGRSFWNPESIWWGYGNFMYKFYVQTSVAHNMVVVDQKMQEAVPSSQLLFHSGKMMQVSVQETRARWSDPPYGGMRYDTRSSGGGSKDLAEQMRKNKQSLPPAAGAKQGELGPYTGRVLQRRLGIVTDDYIVIADYLKADEPHTFDNLFQMKNVAGLEAPGKAFLRHDGQFNVDPRSAAQFITDCDWFRASAPAVARFKYNFGAGEVPADKGHMYQEQGLLKVDIHTLWPPQQELMLAMPPEVLGGQQWVTYAVSADGKTLAKGESGVWILGTVDVDVPVEGKNELTLAVKTDSCSRKILFWTHARLVTADGKEIPVVGLQRGDNVEMPGKPGLDYYDGPIKITGVRDDAALPTQPSDEKQFATLRISLAGKNAVRFKATLGGDYPFGEESQRRKVYSIRSRGEEARFLTVVEPYENKAMVKVATATGPDSLRIELADGRVQEIVIRNLDKPGEKITVRVTESRDGKVIRTEQAGN